ncbi:MAG: 50S ribosomal protein L32 [Candidatus Geothermincolales bacterium]
MAVPKRKKSRSRTASRKAQWKLRLPSRSECPQCHSLKLPHRACPNCGTYNGREVLEVE